MTRIPSADRYVLAAWLLALSVLPISAAQAQQPQTLVASSPVGTLINVQAQWEFPVTPGTNPSSAMIARVSPMELRLAIPQTYFSPPRRVRISVSLPLTVQGLSSTASFELNWQTGGRFLAGKVRPGQRSVLYEGPVDSAQLVDQMTFTIRVDADHVLDRLRIDPVYEIEAI